MAKKKKKRKSKGQQMKKGMATPFDVGMKMASKERASPADLGEKLAKLKW